MATCKFWVDKGHTACTSWGDEASASCTQWKDEGQNKCSSWADEGSNECSSWADEGSNECSSWADEGSNQCAEQYYNNCHWYSPWNCVAGWFCSAYYWVANWVCQAYYWVAKWVCKAYYWVAKWVCKAWYWVANVVCQAFIWIVKAVCLVWSWIAKWVCALWDQGGCFLRSLFGRRKSSSPIKHVFVLMLENRSFDHMLGFSGITGRDAVTGLTRTIDGLPGSPAVSDVGVSGAVDTVAPATPALLKLPSNAGPGHEFGDALIQLCGTAATYGGGPYPPFQKNTNSFLSTTPLVTHAGSNEPAKCYTAAQVPIINELATQFAVCDAWFSSMPGPTWPNRFFIHAASSGGLDDSPSGAASFGNVAFDGYTFNNGSIFDALDDACVEWRIFAGDSFPQVLALSGMTINELEGRVHDYDDFAEAVNDKDFSTSYVFIEPDYGNDLPPSAEDYTCGNSQHPVDDVTRGERLIKDVYETIRNSPHWNSSVLLVTYDEHGGFFDHVPPPGAAEGVVSPGDGIADEDNNHHDFTFMQLGLRVPAIVISPLIPKGTVDNTRYDHTSLLATLESFFRLKPLTNRDAGANTLNHLFSLASPRTDAPTTLTNPAPTDFACDDDPRFVETGEVSSGLQAERDGDRWRADRRSIDPNLRAFMEVALLKALALARGRDRRQIRKEYLATESHGGARRFIRKVAFMAQGVRKPPPNVRARTPRSWNTIFSLSPQRRWWADPIVRYRQSAFWPRQDRPLPPPDEPRQAQ
jgi:phospholipase C